MKVKYCVIKENGDKNYFKNVADALNDFDRSKDKGIWNVVENKWMVKTIEIQEKK